MRRRVPGLSDLPCVWLPPGEPSGYCLRAEAHAHGLATLEAIARSLGILEGERVRAPLERVFDAMVERTLQARGLMAPREPQGRPSGGTLR